MNMPWFLPGCSYAGYTPLKELKDWLIKLQSIKALALRLFSITVPVSMVSPSMDAEGGTFRPLALVIYSCLDAGGCTPSVMGGNTPAVHAHTREFAE